MNRNKDDLSPSCSSPGETVAYLYGEMGSSDRAVFEDHLAGCDACTAEFAVLSLARLGVYEWHRDEFAELATPPIVVPYGDVVKVSWFDAVRALLASPSPARLAAAGGAFAVVAIAAVFWSFSPGEPEMASGVVPASSPRVVNNKVEPVKPDIPESAGTGTRVDETPAPVERMAELVERKPVRIRADRKARKSVPATAATERNAPAPVAPRRVVPAPRLNDFEDEDDNTLRLGDLLAEVETRD